ncbi:MAG: peptidylprolyl isomerase [Planctomycetes bacterium]|nr:peptidylprolyl isomerase [Planctomycetota bacterium]
MSTPRLRLPIALALTAVAGGFGGTGPSAHAAAAPVLQQDPQPQDPPQQPEVGSQPTPTPGGGEQGGGEQGGGEQAGGQPAGGEGATPAETPPAGPDIAEPQPIGDPAVDRLVAFIREQQIDRSKLAWRTSLPKPPLDEVTFDPAKTYVWTLTTNRGPLRFRLLPRVAPHHVANLIYLTELGFYDQLGFHRVITGFMAQGGCPLGSGSGNPGYEIAGEFQDHVGHDRRGLLSTANSGPGTDGSQFFILFGPSPTLDGKHTIFGGLVGGRATLRKIEALAVPSEPGKPLEPIVIESASITVE